MRYTVKFLFLSLFIPLSLEARDKNLPIPRFATIRPERANIRVGPGPGYPIEWVVVKSGVPVEITAEFDNWCRLSFSDGSQGWVHRNMLMGKRTAWVMNSDVSLFSTAQENTTILARLEKGLLIDLQKCEGLFCQVKTEGVKGWVKRTDLWGVYPNEKVN
ncbi:SH3-like domain-containing protein [Candidatus Bealeia paramacronuclearis]|uniref:SH3-like domain-containing protein n=1 Tax=Candidatus Bealeia paramacronuclearis TaxID=1921001 RepID=A0ABZ2C3W4_9PROT|nr:SH3-like domain-containing protein [Candidatus Bealeia paramacronuclearis]